MHSKLSCLHLLEEIYNFSSLKLLREDQWGIKINDKGSGFPVKMYLQSTENVEIKTHFDEKWNYEHRLVLTEGCLTRKQGCLPEP